MPVSRCADRRRKSSHALFTPAQPGHYGVASHTFPDPSSSQSCSKTHQQIIDIEQGRNFETGSSKAYSRRRKKSAGHMPRPQNAFMLFRSDFVKRRHHPGTMDAPNNSLSGLIGALWHQLPAEEKEIWEAKARQEKAAHKQMFPDYKFRPVHGKRKTRQGVNHGSVSRLEKTEDEERIEEVSRLLREGKKGKELARAVRDLDRLLNSKEDPNAGHIPFQTHALHLNQSYRTHRRLSSAPLSSEWNTSFISHSASSFSNNAIVPPTTYTVSTGSSGSNLMSSTTLHTDTTQFHSNLQPFAPTPQAHQTRFSSFFNLDTYATTRSSFERTDASHRRSSSALPILEQAWMSLPPTLPDFSSFDFPSLPPLDPSSGTSMKYDPITLPDVESGLFNDFSFNGNPTSPSAAFGKRTDQIDPSTSSPRPLSLNSLPHIDELLQFLSKIDTDISYDHAESTTTSSASGSSASCSSDSASSPAMSDNINASLPACLNNSASSVKKYTGEELDLGFLLNLEDIQRVSN